MMRRVGLGIVNGCRRLIRFLRRRLFLRRLFHNGFNRLQHASQRFVVAAQGFLKDAGRVLQEVKAVGNLNGLRRAAFETISTSGCCASHARGVSASRSGSKSIGWRFSESTRIAPKRTPRRNEKSSAPRILTAGFSLTLCCRIRRSNVSPLTAKFSFCAVRAPISPPIAKASQVKALLSRTVLRAKAAATFGNRSQNTLREQSSLRQRNLRVCSSSETATLCHGKSAIRRM